MDFQGMLFQLEKYLQGEGNTTEGALRYLKELEELQELEMRGELLGENNGELTEEEKLEILYREEEEREEIHFYTGEPVKKSNAFWIRLNYGDKEYALVKRKEGGGLDYLDYHTT